MIDYNGIQQKFVHKYMTNDPRIHSVCIRRDKDVVSLIYIEVATDDESTEVFAQMPIRYEGLDVVVVSRPRATLLYA